MQKEQRVAEEGIGKGRMGQIFYGYCRVSSMGQNEERQLIAMAKAGIPAENIYVDKQSGRDFNRPRYQELVKRLNENTVLCVQSIDRLGRDYQEIQEQWKYISKVKKSDIVVLDMPPVGHPEGERPDGDVFERHCASGFKLCSGK